MLKENLEIEGLDKTPLKHETYRGKLIIENEIAYFKTSKIGRFFRYILKVLTFSFWFYLFYNIYHLNFLLFDHLPLLISIVLTLVIVILGIVLTFFSQIAKISTNTPAYINKKTGEIILYHDEENSGNLNEILGIQLTNYSKKVRVSNPRGFSSGTYDETVFEANLVTNTYDRIPLFTEQRRKVAHDLAHSISAFIDKPIINHIEEEELEKHVADELISGFLIKSAELIIPTESLEKFKNNSKMGLTQLSENSFLAQTRFESFTSALNLPKEIKMINAKISISESDKSSEKKVIIKTNFRYEIIFLSIAIFFTFSRVSVGDIFVVLSGALSVFLWIRIMDLRAYELVFMREIIAALNPKTRLT